jgi:hypothetical protein
MDQRHTPICKSGPYLRRKQLFHYFIKSGSENSSSRRQQNQEDCQFFPALKRTTRWYRNSLHRNTIPEAVKYIKPSTQGQRI